MSYEAEHNPETGGALGIVLIKYASHLEALKCVEKENGRRGGLGLKIPGQPGDGEEMRVVLDGEGEKLRAVKKELEERRRIARAQDEDKKKTTDRTGNSLSGKSLPNRISTPSSQTSPQRRQTQDQRRQGPMIKSQNRPQASHPLHPSLPPIPMTVDNPSVSLPKAPYVSRDSDKHQLAAVPMSGMSGRVRQGTAPVPTGPSYRNTFKAKSMVESRHSSSSTPIHPRREHPESRSRSYRRASPGPRHPRSRSSSPSPLARAQLMDRKHSDVVAELAKNGNEYVKISAGQQLTTVREEDVIKFLEGFDVDKVCFFSDSPRSIIVDMPFARF